MGNVTGMTQTEITITISNLVARLVRSTGRVRNDHARALLDHIPLYLVAILVAAVDRYQHAANAFMMADQDMTYRSVAIRGSARTDTGLNVQHMTEMIATTAIGYAEAMSSGDRQLREATRRFTTAVGDMTEVMSDQAGRDAVSELAFAAMNTAIAANTRHVNKLALSEVQRAIIAYVAR